MQSHQTLQEMHRLLRCGVLLPLPNSVQAQATATKVDDYEGTLQENERNGKGTMKYANGDVYDGLWFENKRNGKGTMTYVNGDVYEGLWQADKFQGIGTFTHHSSNPNEGFDWKFFGEFEDVFPACGTLTYKENSTYNQTYADKWQKKDIRKERPSSTSPTKQDKSGVDANSNSLSDQNPEQTEQIFKEKFWEKQRKDILNARKQRTKEPTYKPLTSPWW